ncbi:transcriptional regulator, AsnC family [Mycolicibacterium rhodesiae JS60]|nr:transcriptional regulator, AsnC family [Mycolicibacterium rhodesiae JS60]
MARQAKSSGSRSAKPNAASPRPEPAAIPDLTDLDRALIDRLREDGREGNRSLAHAFGVNEVTVAGRLRRLEDADIMRIVAVTDIRLFGHRELTFALVKVSRRAVSDVAADIAKLPEAVAVTVTSGRFDIVVPMVCRDRSHVAEMFSSVLPSIDGVYEVHGSIALNVLKYDSKWALFQVNPGTTPEAQPSDTVDEMDLEIIRILQHNARRSNRRIADDLGVSEGTIRARIKRMLSDHVFRIQAVSNVVAFGFGAHAFIIVTADPGEVDGVARTLVEREDISQVTRVLDSFDLIGVAIGANHDNLMNAVHNEIALIPGIRRIEVLYGCGSIKHTYAWTWLV